MGFKSRVASKKFPEDTDEDKQILMNMTLYCADHAGPTKSHQLYFKWMAVEMEEYYQQGDLERKLDFSVTPFFDRATCNPFKFQLGYIDVIVNPLYETWTDFKPVFKEILMDKGIEQNRKLLQMKIDETKQISDAVDRQQTKQVDNSRDEDLNPSSKDLLSNGQSSPASKTNKNQVGIEFPAEDTLQSQAVNGSMKSEPVVDRVKKPAGKRSSKVLVKASKEQDAPSKK